MLLGLGTAKRTDETMVVDSLLIVTPILGLLPLWDSVIVLCFVVRSSFAFISIGKRELAALLCLSS